MILITMTLMFALEGFGKGQSSDRGSLAMLQDYSQRAKQVLFIARFKTSRDGAYMVDLQHLLEAIVIEDQGGQELSKMFGFDPTAKKIQGHTFESTSTPFFAADLASELLTKIRSFYSYSPPTSTSKDMPLSDELAHALTVAVELRQKTHTDKIEPLHLLAAALGEKSSKATSIFFDAGITQETVLQAIKDGK
ncbi:MAG: Clp protease N-terminal domain-containing protein [Acidobacteriia bacterium]|nr:Clp protease N-terminal domain-containing protein [Terriglobia bacterium]